MKFTNLFRKLLIKFKKKEQKVPPLPFGEVMKKFGYNEYRLRNDFDYLYYSKESMNLMNPYLTDIVYSIRYNTYKLIGTYGEEWVGKPWLDYDNQQELEFHIARLEMKRKSDYISIRKIRLEEDFM